MKKYVLFLLLLQLSVTALADYLITNRKTSIKSKPSRASEAILQIESGTALELLDDGEKDNGYYHVRSVHFHGDGWIYKSFVRRYPGSIDNSEVPGTVTTPALTDESVEVRVVDVGQGLCTLIKFPGNKYVLYDAGHWLANSGGNRSLQQIRQVLRPGSEIELMVLSHTDGDHIGAAEGVLQEYNVKKLLWSGYAVGEHSGTLGRFIGELRTHPEIENINLNERDSTIAPGTQIRFGNASLTFLCGFGKPLPSWGLTAKAELVNSVSIVMKLEYMGNSMLFSGDAVGKHPGEHETESISTEKYMLDNARPFLKSTILLAPHHGADNASSRDFIREVDPETVIISAGRGYDHPRRFTGMRYSKIVSPDNIFRTDRGDDESDSGNKDDEWEFMRIDGCRDSYGDDDIQVVLRANRTYTVYYVSMVEPCMEDVQ